MPQRPLSDSAIRALPALADKEGLKRPAYFWDPRFKGLGARVNTDDSVSWCLKVRLGGKVQWMTLGKWPAMSTDAARAAADEWRHRVRQGEKPAQERFQPIQWEKLVDRFEAEHLPNLKAKTQEGYRSVIRLHVRPAFAGSLVHEVGVDQVRTFHQKLGRDEGKARQANVALRLLGVILERAEAWKHRPVNSNPVALLRKGGYQPFREGQRQRPLSDEEVARLGVALEAMEAEGWGQFSNLVRVLYFSGCRLGEALALSWDWIDEKRKVITWPDSKTGETSKPLNDALFEALARIPRIEDCPWVFHSDASESGHLEDIKRPWKRLLELARIDDLHRHDLRHHVGNTMADEGENLQTVALLLGHRQASTSERYSKATKGLKAANRVGAVLKRQLRGGSGETS